jgi:hypothetical protein
MAFVLTTRFNNETWEENCRFRINTPEVACIYCSPKNMPTTISIGALVLMIEMNNSTNKIEGVGLFRNRLRPDIKYKVYDDRNYHRYIYYSKYRLDRSIIEDNLPQILNALELMVFKGKTHIKRGRGFTRISEKLYAHHKIQETYNYTETKIKEELMALFKNHFSRDFTN